MSFFNTIAIGISFIGSLIILLGVIKTTLAFVHEELGGLVKRKVVSEEKIRYRLGTYLLLGLDFMLAADIIHTIHNPVLTELYILAIIVAIRSVISLFLHKEMYGALSGKALQGPTDKTGAPGIKPLENEQS